MQIDIKHSKNALAGWDVDVTVTAEKQETISQVTVEINDFPEGDETPPPNTHKWHRVLTKKGEYPGDNKVVVTALDQDSNPTTAEDEW
jgi:hypothetical protein